MKKILKRTTLALSVLLGTWLSSSAYACDTHDHLCTYHALGVPRTTYNVNNDETRLVIYAKATDTSHGNAQTDFDNHVLLPTSSTSHDWLGTATPVDVRPFINSRTSYGQANPSDVGEWETSDTKGAHVYGSQYQVIFNKNTAQAIHTGDLNGGEKGRTPYQQGCPAYEGKPNCEAVVITGNVPSGTYQQQVQMFNFFNKDNPSAVLTVGAWATGHGVLVSDTHLDSNTQSMIANNGRLNDSINQGTTEQTHYAFLEGSKSKLSQPINYKFYNRGFDPHASGVVTWDHSRFHHLGYTKPYSITREKTIDTYRNSLYRIDTNTTIIGANGSRDDILTRGKVRVGQTQLLGSKDNPAYLEALRKAEEASKKMETGMIVFSQTHVPSVQKIDFWNPSVNNVLARFKKPDFSSLLNHSQATSSIQSSVKHDVTPETKKLGFMETIFHNIKESFSIAEVQAPTLDYSPKVEPNIQTDMAGDVVSMFVGNPLGKSEKIENVFTRIVSKPKDKPKQIENNFVKSNSKPEHLTQEEFDKAIQIAQNARSNLKNGQKYPTTVEEKLYVEMILADKSLWKEKGLNDDSRFARELGFRKQVAIDWYRGKYYDAQVHFQYNIYTDETYDVKLETQPKSKKNPTTNPPKALYTWKEEKLLITYQLLL